MTDTTPRAGAPLLGASQAQKHVTHNEALYQFDALLCARFLDRDLSAPPSSPADGDAYLVKATATGAWAGQDGKIASCADGAWRFYAPFAGLVAYVADETAMLVFDGSAWTDFGATIALQNTPQVGVNTTADSTNKLSVKSEAALFAAQPAADGGSGDIRLTVSKEAAANTASLLLSDDFSGRAEIGLLGDDDLTVKVSPDGSTFKSALAIDKSTGAVNHAQGGKFSAGINYDPYIPAAAWTLAPFNTADHNDFGVFDAGASRFTAASDGYYLLQASLAFKANATVPPDMMAVLKKNGAAIAETQCGTTGLIDRVSSVATAGILKLAAGDYVEVNVFFHTNDGYLNGAACSFFGARIA